MLKLALVTNARSDYTTMYPVIKQAVADPDVEPILMVGGMHWKSEFGHTYKQIEKDGFKINAKVDYFTESSDDRLGLAHSLAEGTRLFANALVEHKPDLVAVSGDRIENLALYTATTALSIPVAHMCGGDITEGAFDDQVRHAMTKLSHFHFPSMQEHYDRIVQMGEEPWRVVITGDAALDTLNGFQPMDRDTLEQDLNVPRGQNFVLSTFHPVTLGDENFIQSFQNMLAAMKDLDQFLVFTYPNIDPGHQELIDSLNEFATSKDNLTLIKSCTRDQYYSLMSACDFMIGNSSSGIWEAPTFKTACINVGTRQQGRKRAGNVIDVNGRSIDEIRSAITEVTSGAFRKSLSNVTNPYGDGKAAKLTIDTLKKLKIDSKLMMKKFHEVKLERD